MRIGELAEQVVSGEPVAVSRAISLIEKRSPFREELLDYLFPYRGETVQWGITGPPGSGKSTLADSLISEERKKGRKVGVIAVDPSSPFSGGALLGDRVRMQRHAEDEGVFIRSMASRGHLGGVAVAVFDAVKVLSAAGYETVIIETIGVGQSEIEVVEIADIVLLVLVPGAGDEVQVMKAGVMEIGDIFIVNKSDRDGAEKLKAELEYVLHLDSNSTPPPVLMTAADREEGVENLHIKIVEKIERMREAGDLRERRTRRLELELRKILSQKVHELIDGRFEIEKSIPQWAEEIGRGKTAPYTLINTKIEEFKESIRYANQ